MKIYVILLIGLLMASCRGGVDDSDAEQFQNASLEELYDILDEDIERSDMYEAEKRVRIAVLRNAYATSTEEDKRAYIVNDLIVEFDAYNSDSTLYYINRNLRNKAIMSHSGEYTRLTIKRADVFAHAGLFTDAISVIQSIPRDSLRPELMEDYYSTCCALYQYLSEYTNEHETTVTYERLRALYADSLRNAIQPGSFNHLMHVMPQLSREGRADEAIAGLSKHLSDYTPGMREYSILASVLADIYKVAGYSKEYKRHIVLSAISDTRGAVKENMSFRALATVMFEDGDVERANRYLKKSIADANFYSAHMRNAQSNKLLPVIDDAYSSLQNEHTGHLRLFVWLIGTLSLGLIVALMLIFRQVKKLHNANDSITAANDELSVMAKQLKDINADLQDKNEDLSALSDALKAANRELADKNGELLRLSEQLKTANSDLEKRNNDLRDYNRVKEQYAAMFMEYCSSTISTVLHYQQSLKVLAAQGGRAALLKKLESSGVFDQMLKKFYVKFDEAILNIYPSFIEKFNALLLPEEQMTLKTGELLNTELRLYALIRIGIDDSAKIAQFLRCSISTVYTYRSKTRKRAISPDTFEQDVKDIG